MVDNGGREIDDAVAMRKNPGEGTAFFTDFERCATAEALVEKQLDGQHDFAKCHVGAEAQAAEGGYLKPVRILVAEGARAVLEPVVILRVGSDDTTDGSTSFHVSKRYKQEAEPGRLGNDVIVKEG